MKHLTHFERFNESSDEGDSKVNLLETLITKLSKNSERLLKSLLPYRDTLVKRLKKYYVDGVIRADMIESDIKGLKFMSATNEDYDSESKFQKVLSFILGIPGALARTIWDVITETIQDIREKNYLFAFIRVFVAAIVAIVVLTISLFVVDVVKYSSHGLERGVATSEIKYVPAMDRTEYVTYRFDSGIRTIPVVKHTPEYWVIDVRGIGSDSTRTEQWFTYDQNVANNTSKGDTLTNNSDWSYNVGSGR